MPPPKCVDFANAKPGLTAERGLFGHAFVRLQSHGYQGPAIAELLPQIRVEPVLTAHPTEAKRLTVLEQHRALFRTLGERENPFAHSSRTCDAAGAL